MNEASVVIFWQTHNLYNLNIVISTEGITTMLTFIAVDLIGIHFYKATLLYSMRAYTISL